MNSRRVEYFDTIYESIPRLWTLKCFSQTKEVRIRIVRRCEIHGVFHYNQTVNLFQATSCARSCLKGIDNISVYLSTNYRFKPKRFMKTFTLSGFFANLNKRWKRIRSNKVIVRAECECILVNRIGSDIVKLIFSYLANSGLMEYF